jgi:hypothetical protein
LPATLAASASAAGRLASLAGPPPVARGWLALAGVGEEPGAVAALAEALMLARPEGYVRIFADEGTPMAPCSVG